MVLVFMKRRSRVLGTKNAIAVAFSDSPTRLLGFLITRGGSFAERRSCQGCLKLVMEKEADVEPSSERTVGKFKFVPAVFAKAFCSQHRDLPSLRSARGCLFLPCRLPLELFVKSCFSQ